MKFKCSVCNHVVEGDSAPEVCPVCKQSGKFEKLPVLKGSKTEANLQAAFAGESQARNKYTYFASKAKKEGFVQIAAIFEETAKNEQEHAKIWFKLLNGGEISSTAENLLEAAMGENYEWTDMYDGFAKVAHEGRLGRGRCLAGWPGLPRPDPYPPEPGPSLKPCAGSLRPAG